MDIVAFTLLSLIISSLLAAAGNATAANAATDGSTAPTHDISWWCDKTPHPEPCKSYFKSGTPNHNDMPRGRSEFRSMLVQSVMERALAALAEVTRFDPNCTDVPQRAVWADCLNLYQDTILQLNRTLTGLASRSGTATSCTDFDAQTWLSTALTNVKTCRLGSRDLNVSDFITPIMSNTNLSELISNTLALNGALIKPNSHTTNSNFACNNTEKYYFPSWVSSKERRLLKSRPIRANLVVAQDGSGKFRTVQAALDVAARRKVTSRRFIIHVKRGVYRENILVRNDNNNIMLVGDGMGNTVITGSRSVKGGYTTYNSATAGIEGLHFIAKDIAFRNTAGPQRGQAVALRSSSDLSVFYRCSIEGYQDTLMVHSQRQFYRDCYIYGTIDFIFGNAAVVFQACSILPRRPIKGQANVITAQGRGDPFQNTGIAIHNSRIVPAPDLAPHIRTIKTYLGRPWQRYSRTVILKTYMGDLVNPLGWSQWIESSGFALDTLYYAEYKNFGPASPTRARVRWKGFHVINKPSSAARFTVGSFIAGGSWLPATGVPFALGL